VTAWTPSWTWSITIALVLASAGALYVRLRWHRSPRAYQAMIALAACYFVAGSLTGAWILHLATRGTSAQGPTAERPNAPGPSPLAAIADRVISRLNASLRTSDTTPPV
jgi:hypothetical protein